MSRTAPPMRHLARRIIAHELRKNSFFQVCETLRPHLALLMGRAGTRALFSHALALAHSEVPWLRAVRVRSAGTLELDEAAAAVEPQAMPEGEAVFLAQLLGLLVAFIGESLTLQMVRQVWPALPLGDFDFGGG